MLPENLIGKTLNRYKLVRLLGVGGMGAVYKGHDITLNRDVAVKVMHSQYVQDQKFRERFLQEARSVARLDHPGIVQVYDFGTDSGLLYIVMKFIPGENFDVVLRKLREKDEWVYLDEVVEIVRQVSHAVDYAHRQGILHRDIKPGNIMIAPEPYGKLPYHPVLTDLGLAKLLEGGLRTQQGVSMGTPAYMSPEAAQGDSTDARSDVYSLGVLLFMLTTGQLPFPAKTLTDAIKYHVNEPPPLPRSIRPELPEDLEEIILKTLAKNPADRYPNAASLTDALGALKVSPLTGAGLVAASAVEKEVSLLTAVTDEGGKERGSSVMNEFKAPPDYLRDRIQMLSLDGTTHSFLIKTDGMTIGRGEENDVPLNDRRASREHAHVEYNGRDYTIQDLGSTNGTYLANKKLLPGVPEIWNPLKAVRIGDTWLRLVRAEKIPVEGAVAEGGMMMNPNNIPGDSTVGVFLEQNFFLVEAGSSVKLPVVLLNKSEAADYFNLSLIGVPLDWIKMPQMPVRLMPGEQRRLDVILHPPRSAASRAGKLPITLRIASQASPEQFMEAQISLDVQPFYEYTARLDTPHIKAGDKTSVTLANLGNTAEKYSLKWRAADGALAFKPLQAMVEIPPGQSAHVAFETKTKSKRLFGSEKPHDLIVDVQPMHAKPSTLAGSVISKGMIPVWTIPVVLVLCLLLTGGAAAALGLFSSQVSHEKQTQTAVVYGVATSVQLTAQAQQGALLGATQTANWMTADDDRDGISNSDELQMGTLPNERDTDQDGLSDGDEVTRGTNPLDEDTDNDGLKDGDEIAQGIDPLKPDSDGDGIPDASDPNPGQKPTVPPKPTLTFTVPPINTPTIGVPPGGVSLNCDGTYQRFNISDAGSLGKTVTIDNWNGSAWVNVFTVSSGDPMLQHFTDDTGLYSFGGCQQLLVTPVVLSGSGSVLDLSVYKWDGTGMQNVYHNSGTHGQWSIAGKKLTFKQSVYLFNEPSCCPCYTQVQVHKWNGTSFVEVSTTNEPNFSGTPPPECSAPTPVYPVVTFFPMPTFPYIIITPGP